MRFYDQSVTLFPRDGTRVQWAVEPEGTDLSLVEVELQRSGSPGGPWETLLVFDPVRVFSFSDRTVPWRPKNLAIWYRLMATLRSNGSVVHTSREFGLQGQLPLDALEIIRQHRILLEGVNGHPAFNGIRCGVYKRRQFGYECRVCCDAITKHIVISQCEACGGTGLAGGGYYDVVEEPVAFQPTSNFTQLTPMGKIENYGTQVFMVNYPVMSSGDIIVEPSEKHWRVVSMTPTERKRIIVHQTLTLAELDHNDVAYDTLRHPQNRS